MVSKGQNLNKRPKSNLRSSRLRMGGSAKSRTDRAVLKSGLPCSAPLRGALSKAVRFSESMMSRTRRRATGGGASHVEHRTGGVFGHHFFRISPPHAYPFPPLAKTRSSHVLLGAKTRPLLVDKACERGNLHGGRPWVSAQVQPHICVGEIRELGPGSSMGHAQHL